jgi:hypothetical protein
MILLISMPENHLWTKLSHQASEEDAKRDFRGGKRDGEKREEIY